MPIVAQVNGKGPGQDRLFAAVGGRQFPAPVRLTNTGPATARVELRIRPGAGAQVRIGKTVWSVEPGATVETALRADTPSLSDGDTILEVFADGVLVAEFSFTAVWLARESVFHRFGSGG
jgi:hypothetical protein